MNEKSETKIVSKKISSLSIIVGVLLASLFVYPIAYGVGFYAGKVATLTPSLSDTIWQVPTMKADNYYLGTTDITSQFTYPEETSSYIMWGIPAVAPTMYYAKSGSTGVVTSNTDMATLMQVTVNTLPTDWGSIFIKAGIYQISTKISLKSHMEIYGDLYKTELQASTGITVFEAIDKNSIRIQGLTVSNTGTPASSIGMYFEDCVFIELRDVWLYGAETGLKIVGNAVDSAVYTDNLHVTNTKYGVSISGKIDEIRLSNSRIFANTIKGIQATSLTGGVLHLIHSDIQNPNAEHSIRFWDCSNSEIKIEGGGIYGGEEIGLEISETSTPEIRISDFTIKVSKYQGVYIYDTDYVELNNLRVVNCGTSAPATYAGIRIQASINTRLLNSFIAGANHLYDVEEFGATDYSFIINNEFTTMLQAGAHTIVRNNKGFITENGGTGVNIALHATHAHVTHGLSYTPSAADIGITWTTVGGLLNCTSYSVTGITSTQFVVTLYNANGAEKGPSGTVTFSWKSIKTP